MRLTEIIVFGLATWRISSLLANEAGPFDIFVHIRELFGIQHDDRKVAYHIPEKFASELIACVWCNSIWIGFLFSCIYCLLFKDMWGYILILPFAFSAIAIVADRFIKPA